MGEALSYNEPEANGDDSSDAVQKLLSFPSEKQIGQECSSCLELQDTLIELKDGHQYEGLQYQREI
jgi:hypothetical protein